MTAHYDYSYGMSHVTTLELRAMPYDLRTCEF